MVIKNSAKNIAVLNAYSNRIFYGDVSKVFINGESFLQVQSEIPEDIKPLLEV